MLGEVGCHAREARGGAFHAKGVRVWPHCARGVRGGFMTC